MRNNLEHIIKRCQQNDRKAQKEIYTLFAANLFSICLRYADNYADAQDIFQEGFINIYNKIEQYKFKGSFEGWLKKIMINQALGKFRKKHLISINNFDEINEIDIISDETEIDSDINYDILIEQVQNLTPQYRQVFNLYVFEEYSHQEIAELLNISVNTSKSNLSRARKILKDKINSLNNSKFHEKA